MKIDGIELLRMFEKGEVNNKTKIKCIDWVTDCWTEVHFNKKGILKWDVSNIPLTQEHLKHHFEIIQEDKEIKKLEVYQQITANGNEHNYINYNGSKYAISTPQRLIIENQNKLIDEVNKLKNKLF